jgi:hypothetical protein
MDSVDRPRLLPQATFEELRAARDAAIDFDRQVDATDQRVIALHAERDHLNRLREDAKRRLRILIENCPDLPF